MLLAVPGCFTKPDRPFDGRDAAAGDTGLPDGGSIDTIDAPCPNMFGGTPTPLPGVSDLSGDPAVTDGLLELFYARHNGANYDIVHAYRSTASEDFVIGNLPLPGYYPTGFDELDPAPTADGNLVAFVSNAFQGSYRTGMLVTRTSAPDGWGTPVPMPGLEDSPMESLDLSPDGLSGPSSTTMSVQHRLFVRPELDAAVAFLVALEVLLQREQEALGMAGRRDHPRADLRAPVARLDEREVEDELVLGVIDEHEIRVHALGDVVVELQLDARARRRPGWPARR